MFVAGIQQVVTLGALSPSGIYPDDLIGDFDPNHTGSYNEVGTKFTNLVSSEPNLELKNGITFVTGDTSRHFLFDGTDDYIGPFDGAYESKFQFNITEGFTICSWWKFDEGSPTVNGCLIGSDPVQSDHEGPGEGAAGFALSTHSGEGGGGDHGTAPLVGSLKIWNIDGGGTMESAACSMMERYPMKDQYVPRPTFEPDRWYMISITKKKDISYFDLFYGPSFEPIMTFGDISIPDSPYAAEFGGHILRHPIHNTGAPLTIGRILASDITPTQYANAGYRVGRTLIYNKPLKNSQIRQNYFATKKVVDVGHWNLYSY
jgi:hypothetical protein